MIKDLEREPSNRDVLNAIGSLKEEVGGYGETIGSLQEAIQNLATHIDVRFAVVDRRLNKIEATMVTKDYLDVKLADQGAHLGGLILQTNEKTGMLTDALLKEKVLSAKAAKDVVSARPYGRR